MRRGEGLWIGGVCKEKVIKLLENMNCLCVRCGFYTWSSFCLNMNPGGVLNFGLGRGVPLGFLKCHPSMYPFWRKSDPSMYQKSKFLKSWPIKVPNLRHFGANFRKFWKIDPSKYHVFEKKGTHWCTWQPDFATHVCGTSL